MWWHVRVCMAQDKFRQITARMHIEGVTMRGPDAWFLRELKTCKLMLDWWELGGWFRKLSFHIKHHMVGR